ncbi:amino acid racemase [bacterium]|nr:amino acid racemase [bacterium]
MANRIGILGGMTPESTVIYYTTIIHSYLQRFGDYGFPEIVIESVSFQQYVDWMNSDSWPAITESLVQALARLERAGADFAVIATNTMHKVFPALLKRSGIPLLSIIDAVADAVAANRLKTVALLGTKFTMSGTFYQEGLKRHGIATLVPDEDDQQLINEVIFSELGRGVLNDRSREQYLGIIGTLAERGAEGVILGCTEIPLLIRPDDTALPLFDTAIIHAEAALARALA